MRRSRRLLKREAVMLGPSQRQAVAEQLAASLAHYQAEVAVLSVSAMHYHVLV